MQPVPAPPQAAGSLIALLYADEAKLEQRGTREELSALLEPSPASESPEIEATDWAKAESNDDESALDLALQVLQRGISSRLDQVGFARSTDGAPRGLLRAELVRIEGLFAPVLSRVAVITATLRLASLALAPVSPERAARLTSLLALVHGDLEFAPDQALEPVHEELASCCDGEERRPRLELLEQRAEALVRSKRCFAPVVVADGVYVRAELDAGTKRVTIFVPESHVSSLPDLARWPAIVIARATHACERPALIALAAAQLLDASKLNFALVPPLEGRS